jgi:uncharacterized protein (DUF433 family)
VERSEYIEQRNGGFYVAGTRVSLDSIVYSFKAGDSPETIRQNFSSLTLEQVYGRLLFTSLMSKKSAPTFAKAKKRSSAPSRL